MDFNFFIPDYGQYLPISGKIYVNPMKCEGLQHLCDTITHEFIHKLLDFEIDEEQEHHLIRMVSWAQDIY